MDFILSRDFLQLISLSWIFYLPEPSLVGKQPVPTQESRGWGDIETSSGIEMISNPSQGTSTNVGPYKPKTYKH